MTVVTPAMTLALELMERAGVEFHPTRQKMLACGCFVLGGWVVAKKEPGIRTRGCCPEHREAAERAQARWGDLDVAERFRDVDAEFAMAELLAEEIAR